MLESRKHSDLLRTTKETLNDCYPGLGDFFEGRVVQQRGVRAATRYLLSPYPSSIYDTPIDKLLVWSRTPEQDFWRSVSTAWYRYFRSTGPPKGSLEFALRDAVAEVPGLHSYLDQQRPALDETNETLLL